MNKVKTILVFGGGGFIGHHLARRLKNEGHTVVCVDIKSDEEAAEYCSLNTFCTYYVQADLRDIISVTSLVEHYKPDELYQLAADMGGAGFVFTGENDADLMTNSVLINVNTLLAVHAFSPKTKVFYSSSACMYPAYNQEDPENPKCKEDSAYPAAPDSEYGWEKLFSERLYLSYHRNHNIDVRIARFHNIFGPEGTWTGGREKAPAALCRKVAEASFKDQFDSKSNDIEIWGDGNQTRSFLYIDECVEGVLRLMESDFIGPVNIGSDEMVTINQLVELIGEVALKNMTLIHIPGPQGVRGRNSDNTLIYEKLGWKPTQTLRKGLEKTYPWIKEQVKNVK